MCCRHPIRCAGLVVGALVVAAGSAVPAAAGQVLYGSIIGAVRDGSGAGVPGATITATHVETNLVLTSVSNDTGNYTIVNALPGIYDVRIELQGFRPFQKTGVPVSANTVSRVDAALEVGGLAESVTVVSGAALLQTDKADVHVELKSKEITSLPLPQYRNYQSLINLVPGATPAVFQNAETDTPGRSLRTFVNGQNPNANATRTDGATNLNIGLPHHVMYVSPAETIDTVNVATNNFDAEQGQAGGAAVTVVTKSGTNEFRGSAFELYNGEEFNAQGYFDPQRELPQAEQRKRPTSWHIAGGTLGGPMLRNRLFFFGSYEGSFIRRRGDALYTVPTDTIRQGDFSNARNTDGGLQVVYDPLTGSPDGTGRQPFPENTIPPNRLDAIAQQVQALYPEPNLDGEIRNFFRQEEETVDRSNYDVKINWNRASGHQLWGKVSHMDALVSDQFFLGAPENGGAGDTKVYQATFGTTWTLGPTLVFDSTFGFSRQDQQVVGPDAEMGNVGSEVFGIPGTNDQRGTNPRYAGLPAFHTGYSVLGNDAGWMPVLRDERTYSMAANVTKIMGAHELRAGGLANYLWLTQFVSPEGNPRGAFSFADAATALPNGQSPNLYNGYAAFLLGLVGSTEKNVLHEQITGREWQYSVYARDRWKVSDNITLDLGLRYEYYPLMHRANRGLERVDLETMEVLLGGLGGNPEDLGLQVSNTLFAPRLGLVYRLDEDTVVRGGYGVTYNPLPFSRPMRGFYPLNLPASFVSAEPFGWLSTLDQGIPLIDLPDLSTGRVPLPPTVLMRTPERDVSRGSIESWNVAVERRLPFDVSANVAYVGTRGRNGFADLDINASDTPGGGVASRPFSEEFGRNIALWSWGPRIDTEYHALQIALNRPFKSGLLVKGAYTWSKAMGETSNGEEGWAGVDWNAPSQLHRNWARQPFDRTHVFQLGFLYELPLGRERPGIASALVRDWQVNGTFFAYSGTPFTVTANDGISINMPGNLQTADQVSEPGRIGSIGNAGPWFDPSAWEQPQGARFGNTGRMAYRGPAAWGLDLSVFRGFPLGGTRRLELRVEAFNVLNHPRFANPNASVGNQTFMQIFGTDGDVERQVRLGARFSF